MGIQWLKKKIPNAEQIRSHPRLRIFGKLIHKPELWIINSSTISRAVAIGCFSGFMPIPFQMVLAAALAISWRANIFISVAVVWFSNPFTLAPLLYFGFWLGTKVLHMPLVPFVIEVNWTWIKHSFYTIGFPLLIGSLICGLVTGAVGYFVVKVTYLALRKKQTQHNVTTYSRSAQEDRIY